MKNTSEKFVGFWHYGVILTYMSVISGIIGICLSCAGYPFTGGVICLWISGVCDAFDGTIAQTRRNRSEADKLFGQHIDSLSDVIAFGVAPVMIGLGMGMHEWYYIAVFCIYVLSALIRLAHYDVTEILRTRDPENGARINYEGLPVTNAAIGVPIFYLAATMFTGDLAFLQGVIMSVCYLLLSFLFLFKFKTPKFHVKGLVITVTIVVALCVSLILIRHFVMGI